MLTDLRDRLLPEGFGFTHPWRLLALAAVVALGVAVVVVRVRSRRVGARYADPAMLGAVAPRRPGWRRVPGVVAVLLALTAMTVGWAGPERVGDQARESSVVVVALDTSTSMSIKDVSPTRFQAAQTAAKDFIASLPDEVDASLVAFNATARLVVPPTSDHAAVAAGVDDLPLSGGTALGDAVLVSLDAVQRGLPSVAPGEPPAARIVVISDGDNANGTEPAIAIRRAVEVGVPVSTIAVGTPTGVDSKGGPLPVGTADLQAIADGTNGTAYTADDLGQLDEVYADIGSTLAKETARLPLAHWAAGLALALLLVGVVPSFLLLGRLP